MDVRTIQKQGLQVVFLIDTNQFNENRGNKNLLNKAFRAIITSVLRLLTYLANREDIDRNKFAWGCQFFKIPLNTHFYSRRSVFREFTRNAFEDFEKQLDEEVFLSGKQKANQKQESVEVSAAFSLKHALHDATLEYRWDELVLASPQKVSKHYTTKSNNTKSSDNDYQTKYVFVLLPCPLTSDDLECFCEHRSQFTTTFLKRTLINTGRQDSYLFDNLKASLFWLDTQNLWSIKGAASTSKQERLELVHGKEVLTKNQDGYNLINETLALVRGGVIPINSLTNIGGLESSSISCLLHDGGLSHPSTETGIKKYPPSAVGGAAESVSQNFAINPSPALPYSSCLNYQTFQQFSTMGKVSGIRKDGMVIPLMDLRDTFSGPKCHLKLQNLWKSAQQRTTCPVQTDVENGPHSSPFVKLSWSQSDGSAGTTVNLQNTNNQSETAPLEKTQMPPTITDQKAVILAIVSKEMLTLDLYQSSQVFSCLGLEIPTKDAQDNPDPTDSNYLLSKWFEQMLFRLCQKKCLLVLQLLDCFGVLEPLTPVMASVRLIHSKKVMTLEKSLAFDSVPYSGSDEANKKQGAAVEKMDLETLLKKDEKEAESLRDEDGKSTLKCPLDLNLHKDSKSLKKFSPTCFEPWYRDLPSRGVSAKFLEKLVSLPEYLLLDESVNLDSALSQLKQLYNSEQNLPPSQEKEKEQTQDSNPTETTKQNVIQGRSKVILQQYQPRTLSILKSIRRVETTTPRDSPRKAKVNPKEVNAPFIPDKEFSCEDDLVVYVQEAYEATISDATPKLLCAQQIVSLTVHFFKEHQLDRADVGIMEIVKNFLRKNLLHCNAELIKKYSKPDVVDGKIFRMREAELQSLLRFELEVAFPTPTDQNGQGKVKCEENEEQKEDARGVSSEVDADEGPELPEEVQETVDDISQMLSSIPILGDYEELLTFLDEVVLPSYSDTIPYLVKAVFEELGHPVPDHLMSPASSKPSSVKPPLSHQNIRSWGSIDTAPAASTRSRGWSRHPSLSDFGQKRLIIQPQKVKTKPTKKQADARRNLFSESNKLTRRESVAVMEGISQSRRQSPRKQNQRDRKLKTRVVRETPGKRQVSQALLLQARRARKLEERFIGRSLSPTKEVIEESPVKPLLGSAPRLFRQPVRKQLPFYSENKGKSKQDRLQEARNFTARITGSSPVEATDIVKKVQMKKSPARSFLKEVCTPSTLGSLSRLRSAAPSIDLGGSPELKKKDLDVKVSRQELSSERNASSPKESSINTRPEVTQKTPKKKLGLRGGDMTNIILQEDSDRRIQGSMDESNVEMDAKKFPKSRQEQHLPKRTTLRTSLKRMFDGAAKRFPETETTNEKEGEVAEESNDLMSHATETSHSGDAGIGKDTQECLSTTCPTTSQEDNRARTPATKKRKITNNSPRLQVLQVEAKSGSIPSPRSKATKLLASPEMFKQWPRRKLRSTTPSPKGIFRGQKSKGSSGGKESGKKQNMEIQKKDNTQSDRHLMRRSKTSLNFTEQVGSAKDGGQWPVLGKNSSNEELERHFSFTSDDDEIEFIKINRSKSCDSMGRTISSDGEGGGKGGEGESNSLSPVFSGSQSSADMSSPTTDLSPFKSPATRTRSKTPSKSGKQKGKSTSPVFNFVSTPNSSGIKLTLRRKQSSPGENHGKVAKKSSSTTDRGDASVSGHSQSESHLSSENDEVFSSLCSDEFKQKTLSTPPSASGKMKCKLSTKGLYDLLHSPFAGSPSSRTKRKQTISVSRKKNRKVVIQEKLL